MNKSGRKRGIVWSLVRYLARLMPTFTARNLTPALDVAQAKNALSDLNALGELKKVSSGTKGPGGSVATYQATSKLRAPESTNKYRPKFHVAVGSFEERNSFHDSI